MIPNFVPVPKPGPNGDLALLLQHRPAMISGMFDSIAGHYDDLDRLLSIGLDERWRTHMVNTLALGTDDVVVDLCAGTGEVALSLRHAGAGSVIAIDFAPEMLKIARAKADDHGIDSISFVCADALHTPLATASADAVTMAFGLRNVEDPTAAISEIRRILRPGGRMAILELSQPSSVVRAPYLAYFGHILPWLGRRLSHHRDAYRYLPDSVDAFPPPQQVAAMIEIAGFENIRTASLSRGVAHCYTAQKP